MSSTRIPATREKNDRMLRLALGGNAAFSTLSAVVFMAFADAVAGFAGLEAGQIFATGIDLAVFAAFLAFLVTRSDLGIKRWQIATLAVIALDVLWVVGSVAALMGPVPFTAGGRIAVGVIALVVADFAFFQFLGWRRLLRGRETGTAAAEPLAAVG